MERIDRKFNIRAISTEHGACHDENDSVLFLAKDKFLVVTLVYYLDVCFQGGVDERQLEGIRLLIDRVVRWQEENQTKLPDVDEGPKGDLVVAPNEEE